MGVRNFETLYLDADDVAAMVGKVGLVQCFSRLTDRVERDFRRWESFDKSARVAHHSREGVIELMPISDGETYCFKYVNGHPKNTAEGLPTVMAFGGLAEVSTGAPLLVSELTLTTAIRTAATSLAAARALARPGSRRMALIGNGAQSEFQALAFHHLLGIEELRLFDVDPDATKKLADNLRAVSNLAIRICGDVAEAVHGADIVTTITADKANRTIVTPDMVRPGMHLNAVGGDCPGKTELDGKILSEASVFVEYAPQTRIEGEIQQMPADFPVTELWEVLTGAKPGRTHADEVTVFDSVGFALEDYSALNFLYDTARELGIGSRLTLVPQMSDPKNLFGLLRDAAVAA